MENVPLVSIALCTYNGSVYLREQLDSLVTQNYSNLEIIVSDDRSGDDTIEIIRDYAERYSFIKLFVNQQNLGYIKNFEKAISLCKGEYIALCDQDDIWDREKIRVMVANIGANILIYHDSEFINEAGEPLGKKVSDIRNCYSGSDSRVFLFENCISGHAMLFKKELLQYLTGFHQEIMHDWWLGYVAANNGSILFLNKTFVQYRQHDNANTNILRQNRGQVKRADSLEKIKNQLNITLLFGAYPFNQDKPFKLTLLKLMEKRMKSYFSFNLAWFLFRNQQILLYIQKKSSFSKLNFILKFIWGFKLKSLFLTYLVK